jgi:hypothetical protein
MKKSREKISKIRDNYWPSKIKLELLILLPQFQHDVKLIREKFKISPENFKFLIAFYKQLYHYTWKDMQSFEELFKKYKSFLYESDLYEEMSLKNKKISIFKKNVLWLGNKYHLPYHLLERSASGVPYYILTNEIRLERDYVIFPGYSDRDQNQQWLNIRIYEKLSGKQLQQLTREIREQSKAFSINISGRTQIERDLEILKLLKDNPKINPKIKKYIPESYLDRISRDPNLKNYLKEAEKKHRDKIYNAYAYPTSKKLGKDFKIESEAVRQAKKRMNGLAMKLFGFSILGGVTKTR